MHTEATLTRAILHGEWMKKFMLPRYTPKDWWECDVFAVTKAGYFTEFECKTTRSDFFNDSKKRDGGKHRWDNELVQMVQVRPPTNKHELLALGSPRGPVHFWYVVPEGLVTSLECPVWAGLLIVRENQNHTVELKAAPRLHRQKVAPEIMEHARSVCYYRMHGAWRDLERLKEKPATPAAGHTTQ